MVNTEASAKQPPKLQHRPKQKKLLWLNTLETTLKVKEPLFIMKVLGISRWIRHTAFFCPPGMGYTVINSIAKILMNFMEKPDILSDCIK